MVRIPMVAVLAIAKVRTKKWLHLEGGRNTQTLLLADLVAEFHFELASFRTTRRYNCEILRISVGVKIQILVYFGRFI